MFIFSDDGELRKKENNLPVPSAAWQELTLFVNQIPDLMNCREGELYDRWQRGNAAIVVNKDKIVSYASLIPLWDATTQAAFAEITGQTCQLEVSIYEARTGWTDPRWKGKKYALHLLQFLRARVNPSLLLVVTEGTIGAKAMHRSGWEVQSWEEFPFIGTLVEMEETVIKKYPENARPDAKITLNLPPSNESPAQLWFSDASLAAKVERILKLTLNNDLPGWQRVCEQMF